MIAIKSQSNYGSQIKQMVGKRLQDLENRPGYSWIRFFEEDYSSFAAGAIEVHNEAGFTTGSLELSQLKSVTSCAKQRIRKPMAFFDLELQVDESKFMHGYVSIADTAADSELLGLDRLRFNEVKNFETAMKQLEARGIIIELLKQFCRYYVVTNVRFTTLHKLVHFVDSTTGIIRQVTANVLAALYGLDENSIANECK